jgi:predicted short-subunit dehydrogenase-like oxidoreductase (DUF2520 family)
MASDSIVIIGPGRMGLALGAALRSRGAVHHLTYFGRSIDPPPHPLFDPYSAPDDPDDPPEGAAYQLIGAPLPRSTTIVILAVPDDALAEVAHDVLRGGPVPPGCAALHLSGALSTDVLTPLHAAGFSVGSMHPLMAVADPWLASEKLAGAAFSLAGEPTAIAAGRRIANALGGQTLLIASNARPIYHAAAVTASNHLVALISSAVRMLTATRRMTGWRRCCHSCAAHSTTSSSSVFRRPSPARSRGAISTLCGCTSLGCRGTIACYIARSVSSCCIWPVARAWMTSARPRSNRCSLRTLDAPSHQRRPRRDGAAGTPYR